MRSDIIVRTNENKSLVEIFDFHNLSGGQTPQLLIPRNQLFVDLFDALAGAFVRTGIPTAVSRPQPTQPSLPSSVFANQK